MKKILMISAAVVLAPLAACNSGVKDAQGDLAEQKMESSEDVLEKKADLADEMGNEAKSEALDEKADAMGDAADLAEQKAEDPAATTAAQ